MGGISLVVVERTEGLSTRQMDCMGVWASGTTYVTYEDVRVPVENVLGRENKGFPVIMANFNGERAGIAIQANRFARVCLEESMSEFPCCAFILVQPSEEGGGLSVLRTWTDPRDRTPRVRQQAQDVWQETD